MAGCLNGTTASVAVLAVRLGSRSCASRLYSRQWGGCAAPRPPQIAYSLIPVQLLKQLAGWGGGAGRLCAACSMGQCPAGNDMYGAYVFSLGFFEWQLYLLCVWYAAAGTAPVVLAGGWPASKGRAIVSPCVSKCCYPLLPVGQWCCANGPFCSGNVKAVVAAGLCTAWCIDCAAQCINVLLQPCISPNCLICIFCLGFDLQ